MFNTIETLESRTLLSGVTLITHGWNGDIDHWINRMSDDLIARMGGADAATRYTLTLRENSNGAAYVQNFAVNPGFKHVQETTKGEIILVVDWTTMDTDVNHPLTEIASVITNFMENTDADGIRLASLPIHTISQSRGTALLDAIAQSFGKAGIWVDQQTNIDPHPISQMGDPAQTTYDNVAFYDNYWRDDGDPNNGDTDGQPVAGAYNLNTTWVQDHHDGWAHIVMPGYYDGSINLTATDDGEAPIQAQYWYGDGSTPTTFPSRTQTGFLYTQFMGGARPLSGVWAAQQGTGTRANTTSAVGDQWGNIGDIRVLNDGGTVRAGKTLTYRYIHQDRDTFSNVTFFLDTDTNPFNNNNARTLRRTNLQFNTGIVPNRSNGGTTGIAPGSYYIYARFDDSQGHRRYNYSQSFTVAPDPHAVTHAVTQSVSHVSVYGPPPPPISAASGFFSTTPMSKDVSSLRSLIA